MIEIEQITFSTSGGAGKLATTLNKYLNVIGFNSKLRYVTNTDLTSIIKSNPNLVARALIDGYFIRKNHQNTLFTILRDYGIFNESNFDANKILNIHWSLGAISSATIGKISRDRKIFWTLHDFWPITGGCHFPAGCNKFELKCSNCPQTRFPFKKFISNSKLQKRTTFKNKNLHVIAPSIWLRDFAIQSNNFLEENIHTIHNGVDTDLFYKDTSIRDALGIDKDIFVIGICSSNLIEKRKNVQLTIEWIEYWLSQKKIKDKVLIYVQGGNYSKLKINDHRIKEMKFSYNEMYKFYNCLDVYVNLSLFDNFPNTNLEALSCGIPVVLHKSGGGQELIKNKDIGILVSNQLDFEKALNNFFTHREKLNVQISPEFKAENMAKSYAKIYQI